MQHYQNPLVERYSSKEINYIFSSQFKFTTWRKLWIRLAKAQQQQGLEITQEQIDEMEKNLENIDFDYIKKKEKELKHDVMAHVHGFGKVCPKAEGIIHLGVTSAFVGDNTDLIQIKEGLQLLRKKILSVISNLKTFALQYKNLPTLGFTHFQPAQLTTVGKRSCLWIQEILLDLKELDFTIESLSFRGVKGTTGTQASFMKLFDGDQKKIDAIDKQVSNESGFEKIFTITGQTYTRKLDNRATNVLSSICQSASKFANDLRLLQNKKEMEEPFDKKQIGSSAMAYKRNPMRCERISSLARFVMSLTNSTAYTASTQWLERTLDDSANKRLSVQQSFLATDAILDIYRGVTSNLVVYPKIIEKNIQEELPFMTTENILMMGVAKGGNRQEIHEEIRKLSMEASRNIKEEGGENNLIDLIKESDYFNFLDSETIENILDSKKYIGRSSELVDKFLTEEIEPVLKEFKEDEISDVELKV